MHAAPDGQPAGAAEAGVADSTPVPSASNAVAATAATLLRIGVRVMHAPSIVVERTTCGRSVAGVRPAPHEAEVLGGRR
ncbi:hypothetical protein SCAB_58492 [Streptomyces scabiei 87.22]|uniref:Uncharacterized protein n=1 Tax=Streptomyces scabiei (strain 87.22) TaxID=680198 RepID=C9Z4C2_STRSW|nr:hypothetical protein SCAB_58492 [Streptomyces scabiei 87.22]